MPADSQQSAGDPQNAVTAPKPRAARGVFLTQGAIEREIMAGLPNQIGRMRGAYDCLRYSQGRFEEYPTRHKDMRYRSPATRRTLPIFRRVMQILCMHLYKSQPTRKLGGSREASAWLEAVYRRNHAWAKFKRADQLTLVGGFAAFQFAGSTDPSAPLKINLWGADQVAYWCDPEDPTTVQAVATVDFQDNQRRLTLWTEEQIVTYQTTKGLIHPGFGSTTFVMAGLDGKPARRPNPYRDRDGRGIVPFSFAHWDFPVSDFETNSPGHNLLELNQGINERVDNLGDSIYFNCKPIGVAEGVDDGWTPPAELRPGDFLTLPASSIDIGGNGPTPTLHYLMPDLSYVTKDWEDQSAFLDNTLEMYGIPPSLIRMVQSGARSGAAIQAEQLPVLGWVEGRRADWGVYEEDAARKAVEVAEAHLRNNGVDSDADALQAVLDDWSFRLRWPSLFIQLPGPARDLADEWRLKHNQVSLIGIMQERAELSEQEALEEIARVARQNEQLRALGIDPFGVQPTPFGALGQPAPRLPSLQTGEGGGPPADDGNGDGPEEYAEDPAESEGNRVGTSTYSGEQADAAYGGG